MRLIDAEILAFDIKMKRDYLDTSGTVGRGEYIALNKALVMIDEQPTIDAVDVKHGEWIKGIHMVECSVCSEKFDFGDETWVEDFDICEDIGWNYCPNCGAKMDGKVSRNE